MVKLLIFRRFGISPANQRLSFGGKVLKSEYLLREYGVQDNSTLQLFIDELDGGGPKKRKADSNTEAAYDEQTVYGAAAATIHDLHDDKFR